MVNLMPASCHFEQCCCEHSCIFLLCAHISILQGFSGDTEVKKRSTCNAGDAQETWVPSLGCEDSLEKEMATHSSILAWEIPWTEEPGSL